MTRMKEKKKKKGEPTLANVHQCKKDKKKTEKEASATWFKKTEIESRRARLGWNKQTNKQTNLSNLIHVDKALQVTCFVIRAVTLTVSVQQSTLTVYVNIQRYQSMLTVNSLFPPKTRSMPKLIAEKTLLASKDKTNCFQKRGVIYITCLCWNGRKVTRRAQGRLFVRLLAYWLVRLLVRSTRFMGISLNWMHRFPTILACSVMDVLSVMC